MSYLPCTQCRNAQKSNQKETVYDIGGAFAYRIISCQIPSLPTSHHRGGELALILLRSTQSYGNWKMAFALVKTRRTVYFTKRSESPLTKLKTFENIRNICLLSQCIHLRQHEEVKELFSFFIRHPLGALFC